MAASSTNNPNWSIALGIPFLIFVSCLLITFLPQFTPNSELLSNGILADLLVSSPLIYFLAVRKSNISKLTTIRVFVVGLMFASAILQSHSNPILQFIRIWISPIVEAFVIFIICKKFYFANKNAKADNSNRVDFLLHCRNVVYQILGSEKIANIVSSEIAVIYYAFFSTKGKADYKTKFTSYKENGLQLVLNVILLIFLIETCGMHFLFSLWSKTIAWTLTGLSLYTCLQLFSHIRALKARLIIINVDSFEVHNGLAGDAFIQFDNIEKIELSTKKPAGRESVKIALLKGLENHNIVVYLKSPVEVTKIFGIKKSTITVLFFVDNPKEFLKNVTTGLIDELKPKSLAVLI